MIKKALKLSRNFYFLTGMSFLIWMLFFDANDIYSQYVLRKKLTELENERKFYEEKIKEVNSDREALINDKELLEKFAREKYYMKKEGEEVFVIVEE